VVIDSYKKDPRLLEISTKPLCGLDQNEIIILFRPIDGLFSVTQALFETPKFERVSKTIIFFNMEMENFLSIRFEGQLRVKFCISYETCTSNWRIRLLGLKILMISLYSK
jgi:hypothetical protein